MHRSSKENAKDIVALLKKYYGSKIPIYLTFHKNKPYEFLFSVIMSAQCTDERVNIVTKDLYKKYTTLESIASAKLSTFEKDIYKVGFYHSKAKNIISCANILLSEYDGKIPCDFAELLKLPGVGRKTASVVISHIYGIPAMAVDTHVARISRLLFNIKENDVKIIEEKLKDIVEKKYWTLWNTHIIALGREICTAKKTKCDICMLKIHCHHYNLLKKR